MGRDTATYGGLGAFPGPPTVMQISLPAHQKEPRLHLRLPKSKVATAGAAAPIRTAAAEKTVAKRMAGRVGSFRWVYGARLGVVNE